MQLITTINDKKIFNLPLTRGWQAASPDKDWCAFVIADQKNTELATEIASFLLNTKVAYVCVGGAESEWLHDFVDTFFIGDQKNPHFAMTTWDRDIKEEFWFACYLAIRDEVEIKSIVCIDMDENPHRMMNIINSELNSTPASASQNTIKELQRILNEWDFLGVHEYTRGNVSDEYDCFIPDLRKLINAHASKKEIKAYMMNELKNHFGVSIGKGLDKVVDKIYAINRSNEKAPVKNIIWYWNLIHYYFFLSQNKAYLLFMYINPITYINKISRVKNFYAKGGIKDMNKFIYRNRIMGNRYGNGSTGGLLVLSGYSIFNFIQAFSGRFLLKDITSQILLILALLVPALLFNHFVLFKNDKYLTYFKEFEKMPKSDKQKYAWLSFTIVLLVLSICVGSFIFLAYKL